ncbi:MAG: sigma-70 family RNA polymerase sigma factor [Chloroflexi bacterium]|nr:sigma-70 family RNA polymerase sigma factor [Chloroflexota bacterium]
MTDRTFRKALREKTAMDENPDMEEAELLDGNNRTPEAFEQLYLRHVQPVFRYLYSRLGNRADAEDATAETFLAALNGFASYRHKGYFSAWLFSIARHKAVDIYRKDREPAALDDTTDIAGDVDILEDVIHNQRREALTCLIAALPEEEHDLLRLRYTAGLSYSEIGQLLNRSEGAIKKTIYRLLARLESQLEDYHE